MAGYQLSVCAEMVFPELPFIERVKRIHELGFGVEIWGWANKDIEALAATGARFTSMTGYLSGNLTDEAEIQQLLQALNSRWQWLNGSNARYSICTVPALMSEVCRLNL